MNQTTGSLNTLIVRVLTALTALVLLAMPHLAKKLVERFSDNSFAAAVIAQNKEAFERLADM